jgi:TolB-like protein/DNA-binding winged helix-turn-helix (wHTH) protein/Tfp pilus assembly protein PilF
MTEMIEPPKLIPFGPFEADFRSQELRKQGVRLRLPRQSFQILKMLLERPEEVVTREELRAKLWPADTFVDFDHGLNAAVKRLRDTLGDTAENPRYIETLPKRGYRFIYAMAPNGFVVSERAGAAVSAPAAEAIPPAENAERPRRWGLPLAGVTVMLIALFAIDAGGLRSKILSRSAAPPQIRSLAVLPLTNLSGDPEQEYFADGMTEELITELSRIGSLKVISRTSVMQYKGEKKKPLPQIGRELNVDAVMEGSVLRSGNRVRIASHIIYAPTDQNLMTETYENDLGDVLKLQREVAEAITQQVRLKLTPEEQLRLQQGREVNPEAYQAYLRAVSFDPERRQEIKKAQSYYEYAIQKDPGFASAYIGLARCYNNLGQFRWLSPQDAYPPAKQAAHKALELDEKNCDAHRVLAWLSWRFDWDWSAAERDLRYALALCPNDSSAHWLKAFYSGWSGRGAEALAELAKTRELDPRRSDVLQAQALINYHLRNYKAMIEVGRQYVASDANSWVAHFLLGVAYEGSGQALDAIPEYQKAVELSEGDQDPAAALAHAYAATGRKEEAKKILREWQHQSESSYISSYMIATVYASLGEKDKAFAYLERAHQERSSDLPYFLRADLRIDSLRSDPRFQDLLRRMNFPQ